MHIRESANRLRERNREICRRRKVTPVIVTKSGVRVESQKITKNQYRIGTEILSLLKLLKPTPQRASDVAGDRPTTSLLTKATLPSLKAPRLFLHVPLLTRLLHSYSESKFSLEPPVLVGPGNHYHGNTENSECE